MNYTKIQSEAYKLWQAGFTPYLIQNGFWVAFMTYPRRSSGPQGGPRWPYIIVDETERPPMLFRTDVERWNTYPPAGIPATEQEVTK